MKKIKYGIIGSSGKMGKEIEGLFSEAGHNCVFKFDIDGEWQSDIPMLLIDFSLPGAFNHTIRFTKNFKTPLIIGTTRLSDDQTKYLHDLSKKLPVVQSYNFSIGIQLLLRCIEVIKHEVTGWDIEIEETHHRFKKDKPSGTAIMIKETLDDNIPVSSLRLGNIPGIHTVSFGSLGEVLKIEHNVTSRRTFADGVFKAAGFILQKKSGFYSFKDVVNSNT